MTICSAWRRKNETKTKARESEGGRGVERERMDKKLREREDWERNVKGREGKKY